MISDTIKYVQCCFEIIKPQHKDVDDVILEVSFSLSISVLEPL